MRLVQQVASVADKKNTLPILSNVLICVENTQISLIATDLEIELVAKDALQGNVTPGEVTAPSRKLLDICRSLPENEDVHCKIEGDRLVIKQGRARFVLSTLPAADFHPVQRGSAKIAAKLPQSTLRQMMMSTRFAMANNDTRYYLNGMLFETEGGKLRLVATDGHRLAVNECQEAYFPAQPPLHVIVPRKAIMELVTLLNDSAEPVELFFNDNTLVAKTATTEFTTKLVEGRFPDYRRVMPPPATLELGLDRDILKQCLMRAATLSNEKNRGVRLQLGADLLRIVANNPEQEEAEAEIHIPYQGGAFEIGFNAGYLLEVLSTLPPGNVAMKLLDPSASAVIQGEPVPGITQFHVVMPLRL